MYWDANKLLKSLLIVVFLSFLSTSLFAKNISILVIGQSISSNCNQYKYPAIQGIYQYDFEGNRVKAYDPFIWADCSSGSMWMPLGRIILNNKLADEVTFMPIGVGATTVNDWLPNGRAYPKLQKAMSVIKSKQIKFDYIFWHQGSSDIGTPSSIYQKCFNSFASQVIKLGDLRSSKWIIARHSKCFGQVDEKLWKAQTDIARMDDHIRFFIGPDTNSLGDEYRFDTCHLNQQGQEKMATLWLESLKNAKKNENAFRKETMLNIFSKISF